MHHSIVRCWRWFRRQNGPPAELQKNSATFMPDSESPPPSHASLHVPRGGTPSTRGNGFESIFSYRGCPSSHHPTVNFENGIISSCRFAKHNHSENPMPHPPCVPISRWPTSLRCNSSPAGKTIGERQSVTNLLDEYTRLQGRTTCTIITAFSLDSSHNFSRGRSVCTEGTRPSR